MADQSVSDAAGGAETGVAKSLRRGSSVSELVRSYDDGAGKRDRSESGDSVSAPVGKRRLADPSPRKTAGEVRELIDDAVEGIESRLTVFIAKELHDFKASLQLKFDALHGRIKDLEEHVNEKDAELERMSTELKETREEVKRLSERTENAEMNSRIPCLIFSGRAMAPQREPRLAAPLRPTTAPAQRPRARAPPARASRARTPVVRAARDEADRPAAARAGERARVKTSTSSSSTLYGAVSKAWPSR